MAEEESHLEEGPLRVLKWDQGLFEQITRGFRFSPEWDARYPSQHQTAADAPSGYITLFEDFFLQGNFRLPATEFMAHILHYYGFHISQISPPDMVRVRHFEFLCRSHDIEPIVEKFREIIPIAIIFRALDTIEKEVLPIPKGADWYLKLTATPNRIFGENVLVAAQMSNQWPVESTEVPVLKFQDKEAHLYQAAFPTFGGSMGVLPL
ncbi:hypothetical protein HanPI659440_Chr13g0507701 [Helianthus annuus]|nr:hypothetical protein HanPI659440_Chr13g0507701 [Helianthus annuus]